MLVLFPRMSDAGWRQWEGKHRWTNQSDFYTFLALASVSEAATSVSTPRLEKSFEKPIFCRFQKQSQNFQKFNFRFLKVFFSFFVQFLYRLYIDVYLWWHVCIAYCVYVIFGLTEPTTRFCFSYAVMLNEAKISRQRPRPRPGSWGRGRDRGQSFEVKAEAEANFLRSWPRPRPKIKLWIKSIKWWLTTNMWIYIIMIKTAHSLISHSLSHSNYLLS